jgi:tetratricopeptide (TPR) repeat protein
MKAQRRQELKTNDLAQTLADIKEFLEKYGTYVGGGAIIVVVVLVASMWWRNSLRSEQRRQWEDLYGLQEASVKLLWGQPGEGQPGAAGPDFDTLVARHRTLIASATNPQVKMRALSALGDLSWRYARLGAGAGPGTELRNRALEESASAYRQLAEDYANDSRARGNALLSLAVIAEERGNFDRAEEIYNQLKSDPAFAGTVFAESASEALDRLEDLREEIVFAPAPPPPPEPAEVEAAPTTGATEPAQESPSTKTEPTSTANAAPEPAEPAPTDPDASPTESESGASTSGDQPSGTAPVAEPLGTPDKQPESGESTDTAPAGEQDATAG